MKTKQNLYFYIEASFLAENLCGLFFYKIHCCYGTKKMLLGEEKNLHFFSFSFGVLDLWFFVALLWVAGAGRRRRRKTGQTDSSIAPGY